jgi:hypothetical protein
VNSGLRLVEIIRDDGTGGHVWFEEVPGWSASAVQPITPRAQPAKRSHHRARP